MVHPLSLFLSLSSLSLWRSKQRDPAANSHDFCHRYGCICVHRKGKGERRRRPQVDDLHVGNKPESPSFSPSLLLLLLPLLPLLPLDLPFPTDTALRCSLLCASASARALCPPPSPKTALLTPCALPLQVPWASFAVSLLVLLVARDAQHAQLENWPVTKLNQGAYSYPKVQGGREGEGRRTYPLQERAREPTPLPVAPFPATFPSVSLVLCNGRHGDMPHVPQWLRPRPTLCA